MPAHLELDDGTVAMAKPATMKPSAVNSTTRTYARGGLAVGRTASFWHVSAASDQSDRTVRPSDSRIMVAKMPGNTTP